MTNADALKGRWQPPAKRQTTGGGGTRGRPHRTSANRASRCRRRRRPCGGRELRRPSIGGGGGLRRPIGASSLRLTGGEGTRPSCATGSRPTGRANGRRLPIGGVRCRPFSPSTDRRSTPPPRPPPTERRVGGGNWGRGRFPRTALSTDRRSPPPQRPPSTELSVRVAGGKPTDGKPAYTERRCPLSSDRGGARIPRTSPPTERRRLGAFARRKSLNIIPGAKYNLRQRK